MHVLTSTYGGFQLLEWQGGVCSPSVLRTLAGRYPQTSVVSLRENKDRYIISSPKASRRIGQHISTRRGTVPAHQSYAALKDLVLVVRLCIQMCQRAKQQKVRMKSFQNKKRSTFLYS